jgi:hypothetical protein
MKNSWRMCMTRMTWVYLQMQGLYRQTGVCYQESVETIAQRWVAWRVLLLCFACLVSSWRVFCASHSTCILDSFSVLSLFPQRFEPLNIGTE